MNLSRIIEDLPGFKISDSHFRIGSKIHISDFYYAKRFFQNSFFASRIAFILARDFISRLSEPEVHKLKTQGLTLIGYGMYSELLLSLVEKFIKNQLHFSDKKINHNLVLDSEELAFVKRNAPLKNIAIIVPIASTFSTAIKIEEVLSKKYPETNVIDPHINVLFISNDSDGEEAESLNEFFNIKEHLEKEKIVRINTIYGGNITREQKYFLSLPTTWHKVENCPLCFSLNSPEKSLLDERPLFDTDRTSVTPTLIFDLPKGRVIDEADLNRSFVLHPGLILYGHHTRNESHFLYSVKSEEFLTANKKPVIRWLDGIKPKTGVLDTDYVLIIASCHYSNAAFIDIVNKQLFGSAANVIHYDPNNDYIQNFEMIYTSEIENADKIFFVDDSLKSGNTFNKIYEFISNTTSSNRKSTSRKGIDGCIFLLNKSQSYTYNAVKQKLVNQDKIFSYANLHLFTSLSHDEKSPLIIEFQRYQALVDNSFLDSLKVHFIKQAAKLSEGRSTDDRKKKERHLKMLDATHRIYEYFTKNRTDQLAYNTFKSFRDAIISSAASPFLKNPETDLTKKLPDYDACLLKVLTQSPFVQYEPLRKKTFSWVLQLLNEQVALVIEAISQERFSYQLFQDLKFLVRRGGLLNSNYLISNHFFKALKALYSQNGLPLLMQQIVNESTRVSVKTNNNNLFSNEPRSYDDEITNIRDFHVFIAAQIKELLLRNEARSVPLEQILLCEFPQSKDGYQQLLRILRVENSVIISTFVAHLQQTDEWIKLFKSDEKEAPIIYSNDRISQLLKLVRIQKHHRYHTLTNFFNLRGSGTINNGALLDYLWLQYFLEYDSFKHLPLTEKTDLIFSKMKDLFNNCSDLNPNAKVGIFVIVHDSQHNKLLVYDKDPEERAELGGINLNSPSIEYLVNFLDGMLDDSKSYTKSVIELGRVANGWRDLYAAGNSNSVTNLDHEIIPEKYNRLLLLRLNKREDETKERSQGMIGLYFRNDSNYPTDIEIVRYLHLLKAPLSHFVEVHHENDEFREWQISETKRKLALLSGHGKEMLKDLAGKNERYKQIALNLEHLQFIILMNNRIKSLNGMEDIDAVFQKFYNVEGARSVDKTYIRDIKKMGEEIYAFDEIENAVPCDIKLDIKRFTTPFAFSKSILDLICFELLVNAKKNRWHFKKNEVIAGYSKNLCEITVSNVFENSEGKLKIEISNIGPGITDDTVENLNSKYRNAKFDNDTAGTALIKTLIRSLLNSDISFSTDVISIDDRLNKFTVSLCLKQM